MAEKGTAENAVEAARMVDAIVEREKSSRSAVFRRLGITGLAPAKIMNGESCTDMMLERVRTEHARVCGGAVTSKAAKSGLIVAPREEPAPAAEEPEEEIEEEGEDEDESDEIDEGGEDADESEPAPSPKPARAAPVRAKAATAKTARPSPALSLSQEQMLEVLVQLTRCAAAVERLGGIERAERIAAAIGGAL